MLREIFPVIVYENYIEDSSYSMIREKIYDYIDNNRQSFYKIDSWLGDTLTDFPKTNFYNEYLEREIYKHSYSYLESINPDIFELTISHLWINMNKNKTFQEDHDHAGPGVQISGTLYIEPCEYGGYFEIPNPNNAEQFFGSNNLNIERSKIRIKPERKKIVLFPSYLKHRVTPNEGNTERVSISFNLSVVDFEYHKLYRKGNPSYFGYKEK